MSEEDNDSNLPPTPFGVPPHDGVPAHDQGGQGQAQGQNQGQDQGQDQEPDPPLHGDSELQKVPEKPRRGRPPSASTGVKPPPDPNKPEPNRVVKLLEKNPLGMTLPEMAGGTRQIKRIKTMRPQLAEAIRSGLVMPVSQRAGHTVYRLVKHIANR